MKLMTTKENLLEGIAGANYGSWLEFHAALIEQRIARGLSQREVADRLGISQPAVSQFENLSVLPNLETVLSYALAVEAAVRFSLEH